MQCSAHWDVEEMRWDDFFVVRKGRKKVRKIVRKKERSTRSRKKQIEDGKKDCNHIFQMRGAG